MDCIGCCSSPAKAGDVQSTKSCCSAPSPVDVRLLDEVKTQNPELKSSGNDAHAAEEKVDGSSILAGLGGLVSAVQKTCEDAAANFQDFTEDVREKVEDAEDDITDFAEDMVDDVMEKLGDTLAPLFQTRLGDISTQTLEFMAPKCGETAVSKMVEKYPKLAEADKAVEQVDLVTMATDAATAAVMSFKDTILDFCGDVVERIQAGFDCVTAAWKTLRKVLVMLLRALQGGVQTAVDTVKGVIPDCCESCVGSCFGVSIAKVVKDCYDVLVNVVEDFVKAALRTYGIPKAITEKIEWSDIDPDKPLSAPKSKNPDFQRQKQDIRDGNAQFQDHFAKDAAQKAERQKRNMENVPDQEIMDA